jgi:hypothetical protein
MEDEKKTVRRVVVSGPEAPSPELKALGLTANPFPPDAILNPGAADPRVNGDIFAEGVRRDVIETFERRIVGKGNFSGRARIGYLWAEGGPETGRGVGKTALLRYFQRKINESWGASYFGDTNPVCVLYVQPKQVPKDPVNYLCMFTARNFQISGILDSIVLTLRIESMAELLGMDRATNLADEAVGIGDDGYLDDAWLSEHSVDVGRLNQLVVQRLINTRQEGMPDIHIDPDIASAMARRDLISHLASLRSDGRLVAPHPPRDTRLHQRFPEIFFDQIMLALIAGHFRGVYLFIDDIENLVDQPGRKHQEVFAKTLGNSIFREETIAAKTRLLTIVLTTHENSARRLAQAWELAGLNASMPMSLNGPNTIRVPIPTMEGALDMMRPYLARYRDPHAIVSHELHPFAVDAARRIIEFTGAHPRRFLSVSNLFIDQACHERQTTIDLPFVEKHLSSFAGQTAQKIKREGSLLEIGLYE